MSRFRRSETPKSDPQVVAKSTTTTTEDIAQPQISEGDSRKSRNMNTNGITSRLPSWQSLLLLITGIVIGLVWAYIIQPAEFTGANPHRLNEASQDQWIKMAGAAFAFGMYDQNATTELLRLVDNPTQAINRMLASAQPGTFEQRVLERAQAPAQQAGGGQSVQEPEIATQVLSVLLPILIASVVFLLLAFIWQSLFQNRSFSGASSVRERVQRRTTTTVTEEQLAPASTPAVATPPSTTAPAPQPNQEVSNTPVRTLGSMIPRPSLNRSSNTPTVSPQWGAPVLFQSAAYAVGQDYDISFEIEDTTQGNAFLGQCGASIAAAVAPDPTAIEVWLFDMFSQETLNKIFISQPASQQDALLRSRLELDINNPATDLVEIGKDTQFTIESKTIQLVVDVKDVRFDNFGKFQAFRLQLQAYHKAQEEATAPAPPASGFNPNPSPAPQSKLSFGSGGSSTTPSRFGANSQSSSQPSTPNPAFQPRPSTPSSSPAPTGSRIQPFGNPKPATNPPEDLDDDPFGGTGDFTPLP